MLKYVHTCIAIFFHISYNSVTTHIINQNIHYVSLESIYPLPWRNCMTNHAQRYSHTISGFTKCCWSVMIIHVSSRPNWYWTHAVCNLFIYLFIYLFFINCYYFSDLETLWLRNPWDFAFHLSVIRGDMSQYWRIFDLQKSLSSVSELQGCKFSGSCLNSGFHEVQIPALIYFQPVLEDFSPNLRTFFRLFRPFPSGQLTSLRARKWPKWSIVGQPLQ